MSNMKTLNPPKFTPKKKAFSLIELSIVLIIVGLLIAGITGGASLIKSASLRAAMGEARGYNVAVNSFYVQFDALPGDYNTAIAQSGVASSTNAASVAGNSNNKIEFVNALNIAESSNAWAALYNTGVVTNILTYNIPNTTSPITFTAATATAVPAQVVGTNIPASKIKNAGWLFDYVTTGAQNQNVVILTTSTVAGPTHTASILDMAVPVKIIPPTDSLSIDTKMDDGIANSGKVRAHPIMTNTCFAGAFYATTNTTNECALTFQVDIT